MPIWPLMRLWEICLHLAVHSKAWSSLAEDNWIGWSVDIHWIEHLSPTGGRKQCCTGTCNWKMSKAAGQTLDCYCVCCELLSSSIADVLWFVNIVCLPLIAEQNAHEICLTQKCLQIVRRLLWKQTTTHSFRNKNPMFHGNLWPNSFEQPST